MAEIFVTVAGFSPSRQMMLFNACHDGHLQEWAGRMDWLRRMVNHNDPKHTLGP